MVLPVKLDGIQNELGKTNFLAHGVYLSARVHISLSIGP